jgi:membrane protein DedA with SNARE-associated domain
MKLMITVSILVCSTIGGWLGAALSGGNWFSIWSILLSTVGAFVGIWVGYKAGQYFGI